MLSARQSSGSCRNDSLMVTIDLDLDLEDQDSRRMHNQMGSSINLDIN